MAGVTDITHTFDSIAALVDYAKCGHTADTDKYSRASLTENDHRTRWTGTESLNAAFGMALTGWNDPVAECESKCDELEGMVREHLRDTFALTFAESGFMPDVGMYLSGEPACMVDAELAQETAAGRVVQVRVSLSFGSATSTDDVLARGVAIAALCHLIERTSNRVEIVGDCTIANERGRLWRTEVTLKQAGEPLDMASLLFAVAHASMLRRVLFATAERERAGVIRSFGFYEAKGYGLARNASGGDVCLPICRRGDRDKDWRGWIVEQLKALGIYNG